MLLLYSNLYRKLKNIQGFFRITSYNVCYTKLLRELMSLLYGAAKIDSGKLYIKGKPIRLTSPGAAITNGIGLIPEDRKNLGCFLTLQM